MVFFWAQKSGNLHRFSLPEIKQQFIYEYGNLPAIFLSVNCNGTRLALINKQYTLKFFELSENNGFLQMNTFERKEVWNLEWDKVKIC